MSTPTPDRVDRIRAGVAATKATGTASLRYVAQMKSVLPSMTDALAAKHPTAASTLRAAGRAYGRLLARTSASSLPGPDGVIDFNNRRSIYSAGSYWRLLANSWEYSGEPGAWEASERDLVTDNDPFWLLALLASISEVTAEVHETVRGVACRRYDGFANFRAAREANSALAPPLQTRQQDLSKLPVQVWLDDPRRIRQAIYWGEDDWQTRIELSDFGEPGPIELPKQHELVPEED